jgi:hypothetical protein
MSNKDAGDTECVCLTLGKSKAGTNVTYCLFCSLLVLGDWLGEHPLHRLLNTS